MNVTVTHENLGNTFCCALPGFLVLKRVINNFTGINNRK